MKITPFDSLVWGSLGLAPTNGPVVLRDSPQAFHITSYKQYIFKLASTNLVLEMSLILE